MPKPDKPDLPDGVEIGKPDKGPRPFDTPVPPPPPPPPPPPGEGEGNNQGGG